MAIRVTVQPSQQVITIRANSQGALQANATTVGVAVGGSGATRITDLVDVNADNALEGEVLIFQSNTETFVTGPVDGGEF